VFDRADIVRDVRLRRLSGVDVRPPVFGHYMWSAVFLHEVRLDYAENGQNTGN
jgi:hypothetical protein